MKRRNKKSSFKDEKFLITSGNVRVTDPCYDKDTWCAHTLKNVAKGLWRGKVKKKRMREFGVRICELEASYIDLDADDYNKLEWQHVPCEIGVDSGQAGFFDLEYFKDDTIVPEDWKPEIAEKGFDDDSWYGMNCIQTLSKSRWGIVPFGVVSSSGYGDGGYPLYVKKRNRKIVGMKIIFI